jgi:hypothetical protein
MERSLDIDIASGVEYLASQLNRQDAKNAKKKIGENPCQLV